jgi:hypothetical protein
MPVASFEQAICVKGINRRRLYQLKRLFDVEYLERSIAFSESDLAQGRKHGPGIPLPNKESQDCQ